MGFTTLQSISTALNLIDSKRENLKRAFEELQLQYSSLTFFPFTWADLESYFTSIQSDLFHKFSTLQSLESSEIPKPKPKKQKNLSGPCQAPEGHELKSLCQKMDGLGLRKYIIERTKGRIENSIELADAFKEAPNPGLMVLDALDGFWGWGSNSELIALRRACVVLLEELMKTQVEIANDAKERARIVASVWKKNMKVVTTVIDGSCGGDEEKEERKSLEKLGYFTKLLTCFELLALETWYLTLLRS